MVSTTSRAATPLPRFLSVPAAARLLGISVSTLYRAIDENGFPAVKVRGRFVVPARALDDMEAEALAGSRVASSVPTAAPGGSE